MENENADYGAPLGSILTAQDDYTAPDIETDYKTPSAHTDYDAPVANNYRIPVGNDYGVPIADDYGAPVADDYYFPDFIKALTKPFTKVLVQLNKNVLKGWAQNSPDYGNATSVLKPGCRHHEAGGPSCKYLFAHLGPEGVNIGETYIGIILLAISLGMLCSCLIGIVKILKSILGTKVKNMMGHATNADIQIPGLGWFTKYLAMMASVLMIALVRSPKLEYG